MVTLIGAGLGLLLSVAHADPLALRSGPPPATAVAPVTAAVGWPETSVAWRPAGGWGAAVSWRLPSGAVEVAAGRRWRLSSAPAAGRGWELGGAGGIGLLPLHTPSALSLSVTPHVRRWRSTAHGEAALGLAVPGVVQVTGGLAARLPVQLEASWGREAGPVWLGLQAGSGVVLSPGAGGWALGGQVGVVVQPRTR